MFFCVKNAALAFVGLVGLGSVQAQLIYRSGPTQDWGARVGSVRRGNGVFLSPADDMVVASSSDGSVTAFDSETGMQLWKFQPPASANELLSCSSAIIFTGNQTVDYFVYSIIKNEMGANPRSYVAAISLLGEMLWISDGFDGIASGTPVVSEDGGYIFLTYNSGSGTVGHFAVLNANSDGVEFHSQENSEAPFAPPGIFHAPEEGYYDGGENNRNDIIIWSLSHTTKSDGTVGDGAYYAFQFPIGFTGSADGIAYIQLGQDIRDFQAIAKPVLTNGGRSLYWGGTRSQFFAWAGEAGLDRYRFNRDRTAGAGFSRGDPKSQAVYATPVLSSDPLEPLIFGGSASNEFVRLNHNFTQKLLVNTSSIILAEARLSPDNSFVYYAEFNGRIHQASTEDLMDMWMLDLGLPVEGEFALKADGTALYVADITGFIHTFRLADHPSNAPSFGPTSQPTASRSTGPTTVPSSAPSRTPSSAPTAKQTAQSTPGPTPRPTILVESFVPSPTAKPTPGPTFPSSSPVRSVALALTVSMVAAFAM